MRVRLIAKLAEVVDGIDLSDTTEGDVIELSEHDAYVLIAEKWAESVDEREELTAHFHWQDERDIAADRGVPPRLSPIASDDVQPGPFTDRSAYRP